MTTTKVCTKCLSRKALTSFHKGKSPDGHTSRCKACVLPDCRERMAARRLMAVVNGLCRWCSVPTDFALCDKCAAADNARHKEKYWQGCA